MNKISCRNDTAMLKLRAEQELISGWKCHSDRPKVSIICLAFNHELYIKAAIEGFLAQETNFSIEIIIHDDASSDRTAEIIQEYVAAYPNIIKPVLREVNVYSKIGGAFLTGLVQRAMGEFVAICEGDDYWIDPRKLSKQVLFLENNHKYFISIHNAVRVNCATGEVSAFNVNAIPECLGLMDVLFRSWFSPTASFLFRKEGLGFQVGRQLNGDMVLLFECALRGRVKYFPEVMSVYRYRSEGSMSEVTGMKSLYKKKRELYKYFLGRASLFWLFPIIVRLVINEIMLLRVIYAKK